MTVGELLERVGAFELVQWAVVFQAEDAEAKRLADEARRRGR